MVSSNNKQRAAAAAAELITDGMILGLGTGTTASYLVQILGERVRQGLRIQGVPTSEATRQLAIAEGVPLTTLEEQPVLDLCLDGADEVDPDLNLIKGGGGALLREKIVASAARQRIIMVDVSKCVDCLGAFPLAVEVIPFGWEVTRRQLEQFGGVPTLRQREGKPFVTDQGHYIIDCALSRIEDVPKLNHQLNQLPG
ncbi:MAG: ribose-5-phosphate isomerase RpiA, partial [bacterium]